MFINSFTLFCNRLRVSEKLMLGTEADTRSRENKLAVRYTDDFK